MKSAIYKKLREQLNQYSNGFPETESGIEFKILKKLFTQEDAALYLEMSLLMETPESVSQRTGREINFLKTHIEEMAQKGLLFRLRKNDVVKYAASPFIVGIYEYQLKRMDLELAGLVEEYFKTGMFEALSGSLEPLRTIPVGQAIEAAHQVASYADAREILRNKHRIAVAECICRKQKGLLGEACEKPKEVCLVFGSHAAYFVENGMARDISQKEALDILDACEKAGLVNQPANMINPGGMCNCCGDCCAVLQSLKLLPRPADMVFNDYFAVIDGDACIACGVCADRCQMDAINIVEESAAEVEKGRCIGCGLCVSTCPVGAVCLKMKREDQRRTPPASGMELMSRISEIRGMALAPLSMSETKNR